jgi:predicted DCC family thiol-disulfide oxidoreductase YuxK
MDNSLILFDGVCKFCHASVNFVIKRDKNDHFRFCPIQSAMGQLLMEKHDLLDDQLTSMILVQDGKAYCKSCAALHIARQLAYPWPLLYGFIVLPELLRDGVYDFIGRHRYRWFGKYDHCIVADSTIRDKFIE